ncbi:hypothetical protein SAMN05421771_1088 [Granulicella pectinivorans]|uniref:Uncharacterized protein n=1 Tax=Granulicella pectinivorans TaxID=474950 RepID=A0A1I6LQ02_9BACT|nr:hypothetical protein [Granulicella pectinivorans]SFS05488.1 hypothetical protein SAMN05421771_1088 [Granulicella pectinivorans]
MENENGKQMGKAIRAVLDMHADCIKLLRDLDKALPEYESLLGNVVALNMGSSISRRAYLAEGLIRLYVRKGDSSRVLGVNLCFYDENDPTFIEPIMAVANTQYLVGPADTQEKLKRGWDPWYAFLAWAPERLYGEAITIDKPAKRSSIEKTIVAATPLYAIKSLAAATRLIDLVGRP